MDVRHRVTKVLVGGVVLLGGAIVVAIAHWRRRRHLCAEPARGAQNDRDSEKISSSTSSAVKQTEGTPKPSSAASPATQTVDEPASSGCGKNQGPMAAWQARLHEASLNVGETLLALRGGSMSVREDLRRIAELLAEAETTVQDAVYCTGREARLDGLVVQLAPMLGRDASSNLLHPTKGKALREELIGALESWDD